MRLESVMMRYDVLWEYRMSDGYADAGGGITLLRKGGTSRAWIAP